MFLRERSKVDDIYEQYTSMPVDEDEESDIVYDERIKNLGRPESNFNEFYQELDRMLEEYGKAAEERRQTETTHVPLAASVPQLINKVKI